ncbi:MAG: glutamine-hydrolyzing GMP synthase [Clostridia bacterium]|nr:glutamine-hydrolyzing GMP synthase [Clostridia bacterium]
MFFLTLLSVPGGIPLEVFQKIIIIDFGAQYTQLIARRIREEHVYCEVIPYTTPIQSILSQNPVGIIFSGGPASVLDPDAPSLDPEIFDLSIPILGICYGMQFTAHALGGTVEKAAQREYGRVSVSFDLSSPLFRHMHASSFVWMSHTYAVTQAPSGFFSVASSSNCAFCAMQNPERKIYAVQFHPEVTHSEEGQMILHNFLYEICHCNGDWTMSAFIDNAVLSIRNTVGPNDTVLLGLSGGVDSSVAAALLSNAIGRRLTCVYVNHGFMRKGETESIQQVFSEKFPVNLITVDASQKFMDKLKGISDPESKRKIIGSEFVSTFSEQARHLSQARFLAQGTIYPDVIESGSVKGSAVIKSHHNVGGLPKDVSDLFTGGLVEPLRMLFKDEVRQLGETLGLPEDLVWRQPFPGPGLAIRIMGDITPEKVDIVRESDAILREEIKKAGLDRSISQYFTVLTNTKSVGVMGDERTHDYVLALRAVTTDDFMTVDWARLPYEVLESISSRIVNEVPHVNRIVYDITTKPPATVEWE